MNERREETQSAFPPVFLIANRARDGAVYYHDVEDRFYADYGGAAEGTDVGWLFIAIPLAVAAVHGIDALLAGHAAIRAAVTAVSALLAVAGTPWIARRVMLARRETTRRFLRRLVPVAYPIGEREKREIRALFRMQLAILAAMGAAVALAGAVFMVFQRFAAGFVFVLGCPLLYLTAKALCPVRKSKFIKEYLA